MSAITQIELSSVVVHHKDQMIEEIQNFSEKRLSQIALPIIRHWLSEFKEQSYSTSALKILALPVYTGLVGIGVIASYASINLLVNGDFSSALSSDISERVNFANNITNAGALFACITDFPAITYALYLFVMKKAYRKALQEALHESYHLRVDKHPSLTKEMHEELYQRHILHLQNLHLEGFYQNPDLHSETGEIYGKLAPLLKNIDEELKAGISLSDFKESCIEALKEESFANKILKIAGGALSLGVTALASFIILENVILLKDTPVSDLFIGNSTAQNVEAFYLTQLGGLFSSLTAIGAAGYITFRSLVQAPYKTAMQKKIEACFSKYTPSNLPAEENRALSWIKEIKLKK